MDQSEKKRGRGESAGSAGRTLFRLFNEKRLLALLCLCSLTAALLISYLTVQSRLHQTCAGVSEDFSAAMNSYKHSFCLMEKYLQLEIASAEGPDEIEAFLKAEDKPLLAIEGEHYDGVYMYYQDRYLYSWDTPFSVYENSGYDATKRPWYIGAVDAGGELFFSVPYPSYANDYMLATISRLQGDGRTVIAYDIKLDAVGKYVDRLDIFDRCLTLICDMDGNIIGSTEQLYQGGNYLLSADELSQRELAAEEELAAAEGESAVTKAQWKLKSAQALSKFCSTDRTRLTRLLENERSLRPDFNALSLGYAYSDGAYACFVLFPFSQCLLNTAVLWAALSFVLLLIAVLLSRMLQRSSQILTDALTGLNNRRALLKYCNDHVLHHSEDELCFVMLDLNDFKMINDRYGHIIGDHALLDAAEALKKACAGTACGFFLCRYGGDEFLLAGSGCTQQEVDSAVELIKDELAAINAVGRKPYVLNFSCGFSRGYAADSKDVERLLAKADRGMYEDKHRQKTGRA